MPAFDSFTLAEEWISEHYFTADTTKGTFQGDVLKLRKEWDADAKEGHDTVLKRFSAARADLQVALAELGEDTGTGESTGPATDIEARQGAAATVYARLRTVLGFPGELASLTFERGGSDLVVERGYNQFGDDLLWLEATPADSIDDVISSARVLGGVQQDGKQVDWPIAKLISELYLCEPAPKYIAVTAGRFVLLTERERWPEGRYLAADALVVADRKDHKRGGEVDRFLAVFGRTSLAPQEDGTIWWDGILEDSVKHAVSVSQDLRDGIRESIEIIANNVLERRTAAGRANEGVDGNVLAKQSLRFLYRILFLLYAEASPEMGVLPVGATEYDDGYGLERLRELALVELNGHESQHGTHLYESLNQLFLLVNGDHPTQQAQATNAPAAGVAQDDEQGLDFEPLKADLFERSATGLINDAQLGNQALQQVLLRLLLTGEKKNQDRGFVSYANLGINQLGAVYEGLMSYTGFIATEDLHEVAKDGNAEKGSWVVSVEKSQDIEARHFVRSADALTGEMKPILHELGSFVFRLAGRERQQSASYYTPEVLTRFVVSQALAELLTDETPADRILELSVCEPALGSGAFAIEAVRQLAEEYLKRKQTELETQIPADEYPVELQKVKAQIALHRVHGVDLNATAVELAEVSLWLDTMVSGLQAPWFGLRLKRGNSLIGARRATYSREQVLAKKYLAEEPQANPLTGLVDALERDTDDVATLGRIHHFLVPGEGWGAAAQAKEVKDLAADAQKSLKDWRKQIIKKLAAKDVERLMRLSRRVETLWQVSLRRLQVAEAEARRDIDYFGKPETVEGSRGVSRTEIEKKLGDQDGLFQRLKRVMDAWNALWFWPVVPDGQEFPEPPSFEEWLNAAEGILGKPIADSKKGPRKYGQSHGQTSVLSTAGWNDLDDFEIFDRPLSEMKDIDGLKTEHPWLNICEDIAAEQGFFHWELEFASVFGRGGFDLQVGNPPWVRPDWDEKAIYAEFDPWWQLNDKQSQALQREKQAIAKGDPQQAWFMSAMASSIVATRKVLTSRNLYPIVAGLRPDLYRSFMERTWSNSSPGGFVSLIHPESHFTEKRATHLRAATYRRLRRHWQFNNELVLFEIDHHVSYGVHVYGASQEVPAFQMAASLYHPDTVERSIRHEGGTEVPGLKDADGNWDTRPHPERILAVDMDMLKTWAEILDDPGTSPLHARMVYPVNKASARVLEKLSKAPRVRELCLQYSSGWNETSDRKKGYFEVGSKVNDSWDDVILQGPHFTVANPFAKQPNPTMKNNLDWTEIDLEALPADFIPRTSYQPQGDRKRYDRDYTTWKYDDEIIPARSVFRVGWRLMASTTGVRTFYPTIIPRGAAHTHGTLSAFAKAHSWSSEQLMLFGIWSTIPLDFLVKASGVANLTASFVETLPFQASLDIRTAIVNRAGKLCCLCYLAGHR